MSYQALLFCPDEKTARVVTQVLTELDFGVEAISEPFSAVKKLMAQHFDAVVVDCENEQNATLLFKSARNSTSNQAALAVAVVEGQAGVAKAFRIGANLVLTKPINIEQSKGTLRVARGLLRKGDTPKPAAGQAAATAPHATLPAEKPAAASTRPPQAVFQAQPIGFVPKPAAMASATMNTAVKPEMPAVAVPQGGLETEPEVSPSLDAEDAALLESMSDPVTTEISASAVHSNAEAHATMAPPTNAPVVTRGVTSEFMSHPNRQAPPISVGQGAAVAPAKEKQPSLKIDETEITFDEKATPAVAATKNEPFTTIDSREPKSGGNKGALIGLLAIVLIGAGYYGWTTLHKSAAPAVPQTVQPKPTTPATTAPTAITADVTVTAPAEASSVGKPSPSNLAAAKPAAIEAPPENGGAAVEESKAMTVKAGSIPTPHVQDQSEQPVTAPSALGIGGTAGSNAIPNLVAAAPVNLPKPAPQVVNVSQGVSQGLLVKRVQPSYPTQAIALHLQGAVQLQATISKTGNITNVRVMSGDRILSRSATDAVRQWKYKPYFLNGEPVEIQTEITVNFKLPN